jgi:hypothetical protein
MGQIVGGLFSAAELDALLGEHLFPVCEGEGVLQPTVIALDAGGTPVVVEAVDLLDQAALLRALEHAGAAGRMSRADLAARYLGGLEGFQRELRNYLDRVPFRRPTPGDHGARLVIVCSSAEPQVYNAIDFLHRPGLPIKVFQVRQLLDMDGRKFVDLAPLRVDPISLPHHPELLTSQKIPESPAPGEAEVQTSAPQISPTFTPASGHALGGTPWLTRKARRTQTSPTAAVSAPIPIDPQTSSAETRPTARPTRRSLRDRDLSQPTTANRVWPDGSPVPNQVEFTGVFAQGTAATDHLSWDTTALPVVARPLTMSINAVQAEPEAVNPVTVTLGTRRARRLAHG